MAASRTSTVSVAEPGLRHVWLASLGLVSVTRRQAAGAFANAVAVAGGLPRRLAGYAGDARDIARGGVITLRERVEPKLAGFGAGVEARLAPVLERLGVVPAAPERSRPGRRKPSARKTVRRTPARKTAGRVARRSRG